MKIILCAINFLANTAYSSIAPFYPGEATLKNVPVGFIGIIFASYSIAMAFSGSIYVKLLKMNPKVILVTGLVAEGSAMIVFGMLHYVDNPLIFAVGSFICRWIEGFGNGCLSSGCK